MTNLGSEIAVRAANVIRGLVADIVQKANSGHPGGAMGMADVAVALWSKYYKFDPQDPKWEDRDRFVLSGGHLSALQYSLLHLAGCGLTMEDLKSFRQLDSRTPGHPERGLVPGVDISTGPLGQGLAAAVGMAVAERMLAARFNVAGEEPVVDHRTWVFCGDGDLEEGVSHEACSLAGNLRLNKLVVFYDSNGISIEGSVRDTMTDDAKLRFKSYGWLVLETDGHDPVAIDKAIRKAMKSEDRPVLIICTTHIAYGSPNKQDTAASHGAPLGEEEVALTKQKLGLSNEAFSIPGEVYELFAARAAKGKRLHNKWKRTLKAWSTAHPDKAELKAKFSADYLPADLAAAMPTFETGTQLATRSASGTIMNALADKLPQLVGGSADLAPSNSSVLKNYPYVAAGAFEGRNFHFGVRELAMACFVNGLAAHGGFRPYCATFFVFSDYCKPAIRLACLMKLPVIYVFTHDSFHVGEDGATHEPVEQLAMLRATPGLTVLRPADATETAAAWQIALNNRQGPTVLLLTRQKVSVLERGRTASPANVERGAYTLWQTGERTGAPDLTILASGSEVALALEAAQAMPDKNVRVVSMPSWELFSRQSVEYRKRVIDPLCTRRLVVEAASPFGWERWLDGCRATGFVTMTDFGASAPAGVLAEKFGFTVANVVAKARELFTR